MIQIERRELPGVGVGYTLHTGEGRPLGIISHRDGGRELLWYSAEDPDTVDRSLTLTPAEAQHLAELLHPVNTIDHLTDLEQHAGLAVAGLPVTAGSAHDGRRLEEMVTGTGAAIVAVIRDGQVMCASGAGQVLASGDLLIVAGTRDEIGSVSRLLATGGSAGTNAK